MIACEIPFPPIGVVLEPIAARFLRFPQPRYGRNRSFDRTFRPAPWSESFSMGSSVRHRPRPVIRQCRLSGRRGGHLICSAGTSAGTVRSRIRAPARPQAKATAASLATKMSIDPRFHGYPLLRAGLIRPASVVQSANARPLPQSTRCGPTKFSVPVIQKGESGHTVHATAPSKKAPFAPDFPGLS